ncbi:hypothetical protein EB077_14095, partial [bacterium]|nr:hypothetical protein [bacterium]
PAGTQKAEAASLFTSKICNMAEQKYTAILFFKPETGVTPRKYRNVTLRTFAFFAQRTGAWYVNLYDPETKAFIRRLYVEPQQAQ